MAQVQDCFIASFSHVKVIIEKLFTWVELYEHFIFMFILFRLSHGIWIFSLGLDVVIYLVVDDIFRDLLMTNSFCLIIMR